MNAYSQRLDEATPVSGARRRSDIAPRLQLCDDEGDDASFGDLSVPHVVLERKIGEGAMSAVWLGTHTTLNAPVAVKFLRRSLVDHPVAIVRLQNEAAATARLRSANIVQVLDHGFTDTGVPYIVMEWLEGRSLQDRCDDAGRLPIAETFEILRQTCRALARAHAAGIIHRDIKPDNIFLHSRDGELTVKLLDFGIARTLSDEDGRVTEAGLVVGTPHFMSPEQMVASPDVGPATDVWSLGVVAYACLTGRLPYEGNNLASLMLQVSRAQPTPARTLVPEIPDGLDAWIAKALQREASDRFPDGVAMLDALERMVPRTSPSVEPLYVVRARRPRRWDGWLVLAIAFAVVAAFYICRRIAE